MISWAAFKLAIRQNVWPYPGEAKSLVTAHNGFFAEAISDIQSWVKQLQQNNTDVFPFCATLWQCNMTVVAAPKGVIQRVYTINNDAWCDKVFYNSARFIDTEAWARQLTEAVVPTTGEIQQGMRRADASSDNTCGSKRARRGIWAIYRKRLHIAPYIQSTESLVVEWDGVKDIYGESDLIDDTIWGVPEQEAIKLFVLAKHEFFFGSLQKYAFVQKEYDSKLADLIYSHNEETKQQEVPSTPLERLPTEAELLADKG